MQVLSRYGGIRGGAAGDLLPSLCTCVSPDSRNVCMQVMGNYGGMGRGRAAGNLLPSLSIRVSPDYMHAGAE